VDLHWPRHQHLAAVLGYCDAWNLIWGNALPTIPGEERCVFGPAVDALGDPLERNALSGQSVNDGLWNGELVFGGSGEVAAPP